MIVWINGAYGAGKSTVAQLLDARLEESYIFDPEEVGNCVRERKPASLWKDDFQDYPSWRQATYLLLKELYEMYEGMVLVPMTVLNRSYLEETVGRLEGEGIPVLHFILLADKEQLVSRIKKRGEDEDCWCMRQIDRCVGILGKEIRGIPLDTNGREPEAVAQEMISCIQRECPGLKWKV